jgi:alkylhydroperoxidase family enzyme
MKLEKLVSSEQKTGQSSGYPTHYTSKVSMPLPSDAEVKRVMGDSINPDTLNVIKMFSGCGDMYAATVGFVNSVFTAEGINLRAREMIILRSAKILNSPYEWQANVQFARNVGLTDLEINAVKSDGPVVGIDPEYALLCKATDEMTFSGTLTDATLTEMMKRYDEVHCRKYILFIAWFNLLPRFLNACRVPLETSDKVGNKTGPLG